MILHKFVLGSAYFAPLLTNALDFTQEARLLLNEPDIERLRQMVKALHKLHLEPHCKRREQAQRSANVRP